MLTRDGWGLGVAAAALIGFGRFFGVLELFVLGALAGALVVAVVVRAALARLRVDVSREVHPRRVHAGTASRVQLEVTNNGSRATPVLRMTDAISGTRGADIGIAPIGPGASAHAAYRLPTERRGIITIGPLDIVLKDPFGLTSLRVRGAGRTELTVYPQIDPIAPLHETTGHDPQAVEDAPSSLGAAGEEFFAIRPYHVGEDLRRVHWPSTARFDELLVRQTELPSQGRATVVLDVRTPVQSDASLDLAVSAAASILTTVRNTGDLFRLVATDGTDSGFVPGNAAYAALLEYLAVVQLSRRSGIAPTLDSLMRSSNGGALVVISGALGDHDRTQIDGLRSRFSSITTVLFDQSSWDPDTRESEATPPSTREVHVTRSVPFAQAWNQAMSGTARGSGRSSRRSPRVGSGVLR